MNTLRTNNGVMVAKLNPAAINQVLHSCEGHIVCKEFEKGAQNVFVFDRDFYAKTEAGTFYFWKDYYIEM